MKRLMFLLMLLVCGYAGAQETKSEKPAEGKAVKMELAGGKIVLTAPAEWKQVTPRSSIVTYEFNYPADAKPGEPAPVRVTVMPASGGLQANLDRWFGQFTQPDGKATKDVSKVETFEVSGQKVHFVKIPGTYAGDMMPNGKPPQKREGAVLLGGILETKDGMFFIKLVGPSAEGEKLADGFLKMLKGLEAK